ncbi:hypothetical protein V7O62_01835 [Methanolobus sp. ZRKC2]|uniref:hypothetical protein n=1 Tax=Methanolobus sp. ZRKC2 TaxID=3125783 RepID=UPI00324CFF65
MEVDTIKKIIIIALLLIIASIGTVSGENDIDYQAYMNNQDFLKEDKNDWVCVDHAVNYSRNNPEWGMVILSPSPRFSLQPHMTNYKISGNTLFIHEAQVNRTYELEIVNGTMTVPYYEDFPEFFSRHWEGATYFHFIPDEEDVIRVYSVLNDNRVDFFDYTNISQDETVNITVEHDNIADVMFIESNDSNTDKNAITANNTTSNEYCIENTDEPESYISILIGFVKSVLGLV